mmetsp:Transcript_1136/g.1491  ORF Transcript_1136/g.1491 Transcript_1136/m.1491 type:complete len:209 (-) Transcript_1136:88-714(-)
MYGILLLIRQIIPVYVHIIGPGIVIPHFLCETDKCSCLLYRFGEVIPVLVFVLAIPRIVIPPQGSGCLLLVVRHIIPSIVFNIDPGLAVPRLLIVTKFFSCFPSTEQKGTPLGIFIFGRFARKLEFFDVRCHLHLRCCFLCALIFVFTKSTTAWDRIHNNVCEFTQKDSCRHVFFFFCFGKIMCVFSWLCFSLLFCCCSFLSPASIHQ